MKRSLSPYLVLLSLGTLTLVGGCSQPATNSTVTTPPSSSAPASSSESPVVSAEQRVAQALAQLNAITENGRRWQAQGRTYKELTLPKAVADGVVPREMIRGNGAVVNPWSGAVGIDPHPASAETFTILFSAVPSSDCVPLVMQARNKFEVRAGSWGSIPTTENEARAACATGNVWFIPK